MSCIFLTRPLNVATCCELSCRYNNYLRIKAIVIPIVFTGTTKLYFLLKSWWAELKTGWILPAFPWCSCYWLLAHFSSTAQAVPSRAAMCPCTAVAVGPRLVRFLLMPHICLCVCACVHAHANTETQTEHHMDPREHMYTPFARSCRNHMFYKGPGEGEERHMTSSDISISAIKDTTALKVSKRAAHAPEIKRLDLSQKLHQKSIKREIMLIRLYWEVHVCFTLKTNSLNESRISRQRTNFVMCYPCKKGMIYCLDRQDKTTSYTWKHTVRDYLSSFLILSILKCSSITVYEPSFNHSVTSK